MLLSVCNDYFFPDLMENLFSQPSLSRCILERCIHITIAAIGSDSAVYNKLRWREAFLMKYSPKNVAKGQQAEEIIDDSETYFEIISMTAKIVIRAPKTAGSTIRNTDTPTSTPLPPLKPSSTTKWLKFQCLAYSLQSLLHLF